MDFVTGLLRLAVAIAIAFVAGKLISKLKLPSILGWLIAGMCIGPHALNLLNVDPDWETIVKGIIILIVVAVEFLSHRNKKG